MEDSRIALRACFRRFGNVVHMQKATCVQSYAYDPSSLKEMSSLQGTRMAVLGCLGIRSLATNEDNRDLDMPYVYAKYALLV